MEKLITFAIPCYNSQDYMENCIKTLLGAGDDTEILIINDGSKDRTGEIADSYAEKYPDTVRVVHQENGGHGEGVNQGVRLGRGKFYKVVDSDDHLEPKALAKLLERIREHQRDGVEVDMYVTNYVYDHVADNTQRVMKYNKIFPNEKVCRWEDTKPFGVTQYLMMHSVIYRMELLREIKLELPKHTFYVDNLYMYYPFPYVKSIYYMNLDLYYYFIGRDDQSVNEKNMIKRIDQQLLVTKLMTECHDLHKIKEQNPRLYKYMFHELSMMYTITTVFLFASKKEDDVEKNKQLWRYLKERDPKTYRKMRTATLNLFTAFPGQVSRNTTVGMYHIVQRIFKCN